MNWKTILRVQGLLLVVLSITMTFPLMFSIYYKSGDFFSIGISILIAFTVGLPLVVFLKSGKQIRTKEGFLIVGLGWLFAAAFGALPYFIHGTFGTYIDCFFEAMSGFSTTGATILTNIEIQPKGLLFWRSMTHWLGGMGIILLTIALLPILGLSSGSLYNAEVPGPNKDRISPKIKDTAKILWIIYCGMTILQTILLMFGGMNLFDALCHSFGTVATGGFSTLNSSVGGYNSLYIEIVIIIFMYFAGINFSLHYQILRGNFKDFFKDKEWRFYTLILVSSILLISLNLFFSKYSISTTLEQNHDLKAISSNFGESLRAAAFQVVSITTTTGFVTENFDKWPNFSRLLLIFLMFIGGCSGSTAGGMKQARIMVVLKEIVIEIKKIGNPKFTYSVKVSREYIPDYVVRNVIAFFCIYILFFGFVTLYLTLMGYDIVTSFSASIATLGNVGPGLARVGAIENFAFFDQLSKIVLSLSMVMGRLEFYSVLILIYTIFKKK